FSPAPRRGTMWDMRWCALASVVLAASACDATLGSPGSGGADARAPADGPAADTQSPDAPSDEQPCEGGGAAMVAPDGSCLVHVIAPVTYLEARAACAAMNAHLAYLKTAALDTFAQNFVGNIDTWIGGNDLAVEGS